MSSHSQARTIVILAPNPTDTDALRLDHEVREIENSLRGANCRDRFVLKQHWATRLRDLRRALLEGQPQILHFCGHGDGKAGLVFTSDTGKTQLVSTKALSDLFELFSAEIECVVLNACYSSVQAEAICQHIDYVIGMAQPIEDRAAIEFARLFYSALGEGKTIEQAYQQGCQAFFRSSYRRRSIPVLHVKGLPRTIAPEENELFTTSTAIMKTPISKPAERIFVLLVGIDEYAGSVTPLNGCVNDINALEEYLKEWVDPKGDRLQIKKLTNEAATKENIVKGFAEHLSQAGKEDVVLFAYSGHGSQEAAHSAFWHLEPDRLNETLVCYDSRLPGHWDLADKELNYLVAQIGENCPHVVAILDCCHSGSGFRETATVRRTVTDRRDRPLESYLFSPDMLHKLAGDTGTSPSGWFLAGAKYILLAACRDIETAKELPIEGKPRGAFSYFLLDTLKQANGNLTYRDLFRRASALVQSKVKTQSPQLETPDQTFLHQRFLGGGIQPRPFYFTLRQDHTRKWLIDGGSIHRIPAPIGQEAATLAVFPFNSAPEQLCNPAHAVAQARVVQVFPDSSQVEFVAEEPPAGEVFKAVVTHLPLPRLGVYVEGEPAGTALIHQALNPSATQQGSLYVQPVQQRSEAKLRVLAQNGRYLITHAEGDRPLAATIRAYKPESARQVVAHLEHITRWINTIDLSHPATSQIPAAAVSMQLFDRAGQEIETPRFEYQQNQQGDWVETPFRFKLTNTSSQKLYCTVLTLSEQYGIEVLFEAGGVWLDPGQEAWALGGGLLYPQVPREWWERDGITETRDVFKLIVSTAEFDARLLMQDDLDPFHSDRDLSDRGIQGETVRGSLQGMLNSLMNRIQWRKVSTRPEVAPIQDWTTSQIEIAIVRPQIANPVPLSNDDDRSPKTTGRLVPQDDDRSPKTVGRDQPAASSDRAEAVLLGAGVAVHPHPEFRSQARLITIYQAADLGNSLFPPEWRDSPVDIFQFTDSRGSDPGLSILELSDVAADAVQGVTAEVPLKVTIDCRLSDGESLVPIAYDGKDYLVLGRSFPAANGKTEVLLQRLPVPLHQGQQTEAETAGKIRILFCKIIRSAQPQTDREPALAHLHPDFLPAP